MATTVPGQAEGRSSGASAVQGRPRPAPGVRLALVVGLALTAVALGLVLSRSPLTVAGTNGVPAYLAVTYTNGNYDSCENGGTLPAGTTAIRVSLSANNGPGVSLKALSGSTVVTAGERDAGWGVTETVTVPVRRVTRTIHGALICTAVGPAIESIQINGKRIQTGGGEAVLLRMEYLRPGQSSWLSLIPSAARRMGLDRAPGGAWVTYLAIAVMLAVCVLSARLLLRESDAAIPTSRAASAPAGGLLRRLLGAPRRMPRAAWTCALVATLSAACWSVITPPFQVPDEPSHFAYTQLLAETGTLPKYSSYAFSQEEETVEVGLHQVAVKWHSETPTISSRAAQLQLREDLRLPLDRVGRGGAGVATSEPPAYYALESIPYTLGSSGTLLDRLELMRLLSALMAGLTALFVYLFLRELLPAARWAWAVGGLSAALFPLLGFASGAVTPDAMLFAVSAATFYCLARAFRRGLTRKLAIATGALTAIGFLTKLNFVGLAPGVMLGLFVLGLRGVRAGRDGDRPRRVLGSVVIAIVITITPICVYALSNVLAHRHALGIVSSTAHRAATRESILGDIAFIWQFYLPRLPGMTNYFPGMFHTRDVWFDRTVGLYGWLDTSFPVWVDNLALIPTGLIALLSLRTLLARRTALRARLPELLVYLTMSIGLMALIAQDAHLNNLSEPGWAQPRYLLPLLPLIAATLALAARGAGRRWGPAAGALIVTLFLAHDVFSQLLVVSRYYG